VAGRAGKQADGSAKTREAKVVTVWSAESRDGCLTVYGENPRLTQSPTVDAGASVLISAL
jgi:hypothetical protein